MNLHLIGQHEHEQSWTCVFVFQTDQHRSAYGYIPRGGTLIFSHIRRLRLFFGVQNSEF